MNDLTRISLTCTAEAALRKLKKADIPVWSCKKEGARFFFSVKDKDVKKVFAIFAKPCYNVCINRDSARKGLLKTLSLRAGLIAGAVLFVAAALYANSLVLKIEVEGSGSYLEPEVRSILFDEGAREFSNLSSFQSSLAMGRILALPQVTFCNIEKRGSVLVVNVQTDSEHYDSVSYEPLRADVAGRVVNVVAVCGTAVVSAGDSVKAGDLLIAPYTMAGETRLDCLAAGYAQLEVAGRAEFAADCESEENLKNALASLLLEEGEVLSHSYAVEPSGSGVVYVIDFVYLHKLSINLS